MFDWGEGDFPGADRARIPWGRAREDFLSYLYYCYFPASPVDNCVGMPHYGSAPPAPTLRTLGIPPNKEDSSSSLIDVSP